MTILDLMADNSLPDAARVIGFHIAVRDAGEGVELRLDDVSRVLNGWPGADKCRTALRVLRTAGYIESTPGGRGHGDTHTWLGEEFRVGPGTHPKDPCHNSMGLEPYPKKNSLGPEPHPKGLAWGSSPTLSLPSSTSTDTTSSTSTDARENFELEVSAERAIEEAGEVLAGCRGALRDYLRLRVEGRYQYAYVQSVAGCVQGTDEWCWTTDRADRVRDDRPAIVAGALNELMQGDEVGRYFPGPPGDYRNLRSKIRYRVKSLQGAKNDASRRPSERDSGEGGGEAQGTRSHQGEFPEPDVSAA